MKHSRAHVITIISFYFFSFEVGYPTAIETNFNAQNVFYGNDSFMYSSRLTSKSGHSMTVKCITYWVGDTAVAYWLLSAVAQWCAVAVCPLQRNRAKTLTILTRKVDGFHSFYRILDF